MKLKACPACGNRTLDLARYRSMMVVSVDKALFSMVCPQCGAQTMTLHRIPESLLGTVDAAAQELGAGMGREA